MYLRSRQPLTAEDLSRIFGTLCHDLLGEYEYSDGSRRKAVRIGKGKKQAKTHGIECVVMPFPDIVGRNEFWTIFFADTTNADYQRVRGIIQILQNNFLKIQSLSVENRNDELETDDQIVLILDRGQLEVARGRLFGSR
jgi:hypothetical protein